MSKSDWNMFLVLVAIATAILAAGAATAVRSRRQLLLPLATSFVVSTIIYIAVMSTLDVNTGEKGADLFHLAAVIVLCVAPVVGALLDRIRMAGELLAYVAWSLVGACLPPVALIALLLVSCGGGDCFS